MLRVLKSLSLIVVSTVITLLVAELILHLVPSLLPVEIRQGFGNKGVSHPEIGNLPLPRSNDVVVTRDFETPYELDANGFRNEADWPDTVDVVAVGDSLVFGYGVDTKSAWPQIVANRTNSNVVNLGLIGGAPQQYQKVYEIFGRSLAPKLLVVGFFGRNDFWDANMFASWQRSGDAGNYLHWRGFGAPTAEQLKSPFYRALFYVRKRSYVLALGKLGQDVLSSRAAGGDPQQLKFADGSQMSLHQVDFTSKTSRSAPGNASFETVVDSLNAIQRFCDEDGTQLVVLFQPAKEEVYRPAGDNASFDATKELRQALTSAGIDFIDAGPAFRENADSGDILFYPTDGHPNAAGYALLADLVVDYVRRLDHENK